MTKNRKIINYSNSRDFRAFLLHSLTSQGKYFITFSPSPPHTSCELNEIDDLNKRSKILSFAFRRRKISARFLCPRFMYQILLIGRRIRPLKNQNSCIKNGKFFSGNFWSRWTTSGESMACVCRRLEHHLDRKKSPFYFLYLSNQSSINFFLPSISILPPTAQQRTSFFYVATHPRKDHFKNDLHNSFAEDDMRAKMEGRGQGHFCKSATIGRNIIEIGLDEGKRGNLVPRPRKRREKSK